MSPPSRIDASELAKSLSSVELTPTALRFKVDVSYEEWTRVGAALQRVEAALSWWLGDWANYGEHRYGERYAQAVEVSEATGQPLGTVRIAQWVSERLPVVRRRTNLSWSHHREVAGLESEIADELLLRAEQGEELPNGERRRWSQRDLRSAVRVYRQEMARRQAGPLPGGRYRVILADPPWAYSDQLIEGYGAAEHHYPTMPAQEIADLAVDDKPVSDIAMPDAALFLWTTSPLLPAGLDVMGAWGFQYRASFVWDKVRHNWGHYNSVRHELLLLGTRGSCLPDSDTLPDSVVSIERSAVHSEKPEEFRALIESMYSDGPRPYLELFATAEHEGWIAWGTKTASTSPIG